MTTTLAASAGAQTLPAGWTLSNVGNPVMSGAATFNSGTYSVSGAGTDVWGSSDEFTFLHRQVPEDATIIARVATLQNINGWSKAGVMIRESLAAGSKYAFALVTPSHGITFQRRTTTGGASSQTNVGAGTAPVWLKLERRSNTVTAYGSANGTTWSSFGSATVSMSATVYVGLAVASLDLARTATSTFTNVSATSDTTESLPTGWTAGDIGAPAIAGSTQYASGTFTVQGAGVDVWDRSDQFRYVYQAFTGDIEITGRVVSLEHTNAWAKAGVMIRETLAATAVQTSLVVTPGYGTNFYRRLTTGDVTQPGAVGTAGAPYWVRLTRQGSTVTGYQSSDGVTWTAVGTATMAATTLYVGLEVTSHDPAQAATAVFDNVTVRIPSANQAPTVALTAPVDGATLTAPATLTVSASASDIDGTVSSVSFYAGATLIGTATTSPYSVTWNAVPAGSYSLTAVAWDNAGTTTTSAARSVTVTGAVNQPPAVSLTAPANGAAFPDPATITVTATASDSDGTVARVEFWVGPTLIGSDTTAPYATSWNNVPAGSYALVAVAWDNAGTTTTSAARSVTVTAAGLPAGWTAADIGAPAIAGATQYADGTFTVEGAGVDVWDRSDQFRYVYQPFSGDIEITSRVMSLEHTNAWAKAGVMIRETLAATAVQTSLVVTPGYGTNFYRRLTTGDVTQPGSVGTVGAPYWVRLARQGSTVTGYQSSDGVTWTAVGTATMAAATLYVGLEVTSHNPAQAATAVFDNVTVRIPTANQAPAVFLTAPANGAAFPAPATITVSATASDSDGTVATVEFYAGATLIGSDTTSPYSVTWSNVPAGSYPLTARARDNTGTTTTSDARSITVSGANQAPNVSLTAPAAGAVYTAPASVTITADASDADGSVTRVEFWVGPILIGSDSTAPYAMSWSNVPVGLYALVAVAWDNAGAMTVSGTRDIRVDAAGLPRTAIFTASTNHATAVDRYFLEIFPAGANPTVANPVATQDLGKPSMVAGEILVDISQTTTALPSGSYIATVTAIGAGGSARSAASPSFIR